MRVAAAAALLLLACVPRSLGLDDRAHDEALVPSAEDAFPNLVYVKVPKTASSTTGGIARRLAATHGVWGHKHGWLSDEPNPKCWIDIEPGLWANHANRTWIEPRLAQLAQPAFRFTMIRDPADRCLSHFMHVEVEREGKANTPANKIHALSGKSPHCAPNYMLAYIAPPGFDVDHATRASIATMLKTYYDFVGVDSMFEESVVVLANKLGAHLGDVLYTSAKRSDEGMVDPTTGEPLPRHLPMSEEDPAVQTYAASEEYRRKNAGDFMLVDIVTSSVRDALAGSEKLRRSLEKFHEMKEEVETRCEGDEEAMSVCYWTDNGCGYECLDQVAARHNALA